MSYSSYAPWFNYSNIRFEVLMAVKISVLVFWAVTPCGLVALKMEAGCFSEMFVPTYKSTWHYNPKGQH
jgi:hypothetical protein